MSQQLQFYDLIEIENLNLNYLNFVNFNYKTIRYFYTILLTFKILILTRKMLINSC